MADTGLNIETPQDVLARLQAERQVAFLSGNPNTARTANTQRVLDTLFGNPQVRAAKQRQEAINSAVAELRQGEDEDELSYEHRRLGAMRKAVEQFDPGLADKIRLQQAALSQEIFERSRLLNSERRAEADAKLRQEAAQREAEEFETITAPRDAKYLLDQNTGKYTVYGPGEEGKYRLDLRNKNLTPITQEQAFKLVEDQQAEASGGGSYSKMIQSRVDKETYTLLSALDPMNNLLEFLVDNPDALTQTEKWTGNMAQLRRESEAAVAKAGGRTTEGSSIPDMLDRANLSSSGARALVMNVAYALARANDPGGRLSDRDVLAAIEMVGQNPDPRVLASNLHQQMDARTRSVIDYVNTAPENIAMQFGPRLDAIRQRKTRFDGNYQRLMGPATGPGFTIPPQPTPGGEGWTDYDKGRVRRIGP